MFRSLAMLTIGALLLLAPCAAAKDTHQWEVVLDAPIAEVWRAFTVEEEIEKWMVPNCKVDLRPGGTLQTNYDANAEIGGPGTIVHTYLAIEPERMLASRVTVPEGAPVPKCIEQAWGVTRFEPIAPNRTRVTLTSCGWGEGPDWDQAAEFFEVGNAWTLEQLKKLFPSPSAADNDRAFAEISQLIGGEWIHENAMPDGAVFRVRNTAERGPSELCIVTAGWLGNDQGMFPHSAAQIWREPGTGRVVFQSIDENGAVATGDITLTEDGSLLWDWTMHRQRDEMDRFRVTMKFTGPDAYTMNITRLLADGAESPMIVNAAFQRVEKAPEAFHKPHPNLAAH